MTICSIGRSLPSASVSLPLSSTMLPAGNGTLTADWRKTGYGWVLKQRYFGEVE